MKRKVIILLIFTFTIFLINVWGGSIYYLETFDNYSSFTSHGWNPDYRYGRDGVFYPASTSVVTNTNSTLYIKGLPDYHDLSYNNYWVGRVTKFEPDKSSIGKSISATPIHPFGFQIVRYYSYLDPRSGSGYHQVSLNVWLIRNEPSKTNQWDVIDNFVYFMEISKATSSPYSTFGYFSGSEQLPDLTTLVGPTGAIHDFTSWQKNAVADNDPLGIRIIHNGTKVSFYLNPNPIDGDGIRDTEPNEYYLLGSVNVGWNTNLAVMIGHENLYFWATEISARYDNFLIRTIASNITAEITPVKVRKDKDIDFTLLLKGEFSTNDAGIGEILIRKPIGYGNWNLTNVNVYTNNVLMGKVLNSDSNPSQGSVALSITNSGSDLKIRFNKTSGAINDIINYFKNREIKISFKLHVPLWADATGKEFEVFVNNEKYSDTGGDITLGGTIKYATTGWQEATAGDAGTNVNTSSLLVKVYNDPKAYAGITVYPNPVYEDNSGTVKYTYSYEFSTTGIVDSPDISKVIINVPSGINISNVNSLLILDDENNISITNNKIIINYYADNVGKLPSPNGYDRVTIEGYGTPDLPINTLYSNYLWDSLVSSENIVTGSSNQYTVTNSIYPSQTIKVIVVSPEAVGSIDLTNGVGVPRISNSKKTNGFVYTILNNGNTKILKMKIVIPEVFTNVFNITSEILGSSINFVTNSNIIYLDYLANGTNISPSSVDKVKMVLVHNRVISDSATNVEVKCYADNGNTEGWVKGTASSVPGWSIDILPPDPSGQSYVKTNVIYTTLSTVWDTNIINYYIFNNGAIGNNLAKAKIIIPAPFQILEVSSSHILNDGTMITINGNEITLDYNNDANGALKSYIEVSSEKDIVTIKLRDTLSSPTNFNIECMVQNVAKTDWQSTTDYPGETRTLSVEYPYVNASGYIIVDSDPVNNIIDSSTVTNSLSYIITNQGKKGNRILHAQIFVPTTISTNIINITSDKILSDGSYIVYDKNNGIIYLNYINDANGPLLGGEKDTIHFTMIDKIEGEGVYTLISKVSNDRELSSCDIYSGKSQSITFDIPDADGAMGLGYKYIYTLSSPQIEDFNIIVKNKGKGSNRIKKCLITFPAIFGNKVTGIKSSYLGLNESSININLTSTYAEILYESAGNELDSGATDIITLTYTNNFTDTNKAIWNVSVDNGDGKGYVSTSILTNYTNQMEIIVPADVSITPDTVYTTSTNLTFTYTIHNGELIKSRDIYRSRIIIPSPFNVTNIKNVSDTLTSSVISIVSNYILLNYSANLLQPGAQDIVSFTFNRIAQDITTNVDFICEVDYNYISGYRDTVVLSGNNNSVNVIAPPSSAIAASYPNKISKDITYSPYTISIQNVASGNNFIYQAKIKAPPFITNISSVTSEILNNNVIISNNVIILKYFQYGTNISPFNSDQISFLGYDNIDIVTQGSWIVEVNNTTNNTFFTQASVTPGKSLGLSLYIPSYNAYASVSPVLLDVTAVTNNILFNIINSSGDTSKIQKLKIFIPPEFNTNNISISNTLPAVISYNSSYILIDYISSNTYISPTYGDTIYLRIKDNLTGGEGKAYWYSSVNYSSSGDAFITNNVSPGKSVTNHFYMPDPEYSYDYNVNELYLTANNFNSIFIITNKGIGTHTFNNIKIEIPPIFTNGLTLAKISSLLATNINLNNNIITFSYSNFTPLKYDTIQIRLLNTNNMSSLEAFNITISNGYNSSIFNPSISLVTPPSATISPSEVYSTSYSNNFSFTFKNDGSGNNSINSKVIILLPDIITNVRNINILSGSPFVYTNNKIIIDYLNNPLLSGNLDVIDFTIFDKITLKETNVIFDAIITNSAGSFYISRNSTNFTKVSYSIPELAAYGWIDTPEWIFTTKKTNDMLLKIYNNGIAGNDIRKAVINLPSGLLLFTNTIHSSYLTNNEFINGNSSSITLYYLKNTNGNGSLISGATDYISFRLAHTFDVETNVFINFMADNGKYFTNVDTLTPKKQYISIRFPDEDSKFYIKSPFEIYTIETNGSISFNVVNNSYLAEISKLYINFNTNILKVESVNTEVSNYISYLSNYLILSFNKDEGIATRSSREITINVKYHYSQNTNFIFDSKAIFEGNNDLINLVVPPGETNILYLRISDFGKIQGTVSPDGIITTVEVLNSSGENITNKYGDIVQASVNPDTGVYVINYVPAGTYNLRFTSKEYRVTYYNNVTVVNNKYTYLPEVILRNKILNNDDTVVRTIYADDKISYVLFPSESVINDFYLDIYKVNIDNEKSSAILKNEKIIKGNNPDNLKVFNFVLQNNNEEDINEMEIGKSITIVLHYSDEEIASQGWSEDSLAIFYYKENTKEWVRIGGIVDKDNNTVTVKVNYLHRYYAIFGAKSVDYTKIFGDFKCWPRQFSPTSGGRSYQNLHISFTFKEGVENFTFSVYTLSGKLVYRKDYNNGIYYEGEIYWNGRDNDGYILKSGVYIYQIEVNDTYYRGSVLLMK